MALAHTSTLAYAADETAPVDADAEFIEFLGEWQTDDGEWVDPEQLDTEAYTRAVNELEQTPAERQGDE